MTEHSPGPTKQSQEPNKLQPVVETQGPQRLPSPLSTTAQPPLTPKNILHLQRTIGNQAVQRMVISQRTPTIQREITYTKGGWAKESWQGKWYAWRDDKAEGEWNELEALYNKVIAAYDDLTDLNTSETDEAKVIKTRIGTLEEKSIDYSKRVETKQALETLETDIGDLKRKNVQRVEQERLLREAEEKKRQEEEKKQQEELQRIKDEEEKIRKAAELKRLQEDAKRKKEEEEKARLEEEKRLKEEAEKRKQEEEENARVAEAKRLKDEAKRLEREEKKRIAREKEELESRHRTDSQEQWRVFVENLRESTRTTVSTEKIFPWDWEKGEFDPKMSNYGASLWGNYKKLTELGEKTVLVTKTMTNASKAWDKILNEKVRVHLIERTVKQFELDHHLYHPTAQGILDGINNTDTDVTVLAKLQTALDAQKRATGAKWQQYLGMTQYKLVYPEKTFDGQTIHITFDESSIVAGNIIDLNGKTADGLIDELFSTPSWQWRIHATVEVTTLLSSTGRDREPPNPHVYWRNNGGTYPRNHLHLLGTGRQNDGYTALENALTEYVKKSIKPKVQTAIDQNGYPIALLR